MESKEIAELLSILRTSLIDKNSQFYTDKKGSRSLKVQFLKTTETFNISDTATHFLWKFHSIDNAALFIKNYMEPETNDYFSFSIKSRK